MPTAPPADEGAEIRALIVALATGARAGVPEEQLARMAAEHLLACIPATAGERRAKNEAIRLYARMIGEQNRLLVDAMGRWNTAAGEGDPAGQWMADLAAAVARGRAGIDTTTPAPVVAAPVAPAETAPDATESGPGTLPVAGRADALAAAVQLVTACRTSPPGTGAFGKQVVAVIADLGTRYPRLHMQVVAWLIGHLAAQAAYACDRWENATGGTPAADWLAQLDSYAHTRKG